MSFPCGHNLAYDRSDQTHFSVGKPVAARKVARRTGRANITPNVWVGVVYTVKPSRTLDGPAIHARFPYKLKNFLRVKVASIRALVGFTEEDRSPLIGLAVFLVARFSFVPLFWSHINPALFSAVTSLFTGVVARLTLVRQSEGAIFFPVEIFRDCCKTVLTAKASA